MIKNFMIKYLERRGYLVVRHYMPMIVLSGNAVATKSPDGTAWEVSFMTSPFMVALRGTHITTTEQ